MPDLNKKRNFISLFIDFLQREEKHTSSAEKEKGWASVEKRARLLGKRRLLYKRLCYCAAAAAVLAGLIFFLQPETSRDSEMKEIASKMIVDTHSDQITLQIEADKNLLIKDSSVVRYDAEGRLLSEKENEPAPASSPEKAVEYHTLYVPQGKRTMLELSDKSKIWVNSRTKIVYPSHFTGKKREIFVDGEVYCEITHDEQRPFLVKTSRNIEIQVLGTSFNVCSYAGRGASSIVLVNGRVSVTGENHKKAILEPNQLIEADFRGFGEKRYVNAADYISWTKGFFNIHSETLESVIKRLEIYFDTTIVIKDHSLKHKRISGKLVLMDSLDSIIGGLSNILPLTYTVNDKTYEIHQKTE